MIQIPKKDIMFKLSNALMQSYLYTMSNPITLLREVNHLNRGILVKISKECDKKGILIFSF
jgi:hypothetical protein